MYSAMTFFVIHRVVQLSPQPILEHFLFSQNETLYSLAVTPSSPPIFQP